MCSVCFVLLSAVFFFPPAAAWGNNTHTHTHTHTHTQTYTHKPELICSGSLWFKPLSLNLSSLPFSRLSPSLRRCLSPSPITSYYSLSHTHTHTHTHTHAHTHTHTHTLSDKRPGPWLYLVVEQSPSNPWPWLQQWPKAAVLNYWHQTDPERHTPGPRDPPCEEALDQIFINWSASPRHRDPLWEGQWDFIINYKHWKLIGMVLKFISFIDGRLSSAKRTAKLKLPGMNHWLKK